MSDLPLHLVIALSEVGYRETPRNKTPFTARYDAHGDYSYQGQAWCAIFACDCLERAGITLPVMQYGNYPRAASVQYLMDGCKAQGWFKATPEVGDLVFFDHHVGFVLRVEGELIISVEGNTTGPTSTTEWVWVHGHNIADCLGFASVPMPAKMKEGKDDEGISGSGIDGSGDCLRTG